MSRTFQWYVACRLHTRKLGRFPTFSGLGLFFYHNLCFRCPNGPCKPILDIYASGAFQWYKEFFEPMGFDPCNYALMIGESIWDSNSQHGSSFRSVRVHSLTLFALPGAHEMTCGSPSWLVTLQPLALVVNPRLGLQHKFPKLGLSRLLGPIILHIDLWLRWGLKQSCSLRRELFNIMLHAHIKIGAIPDFWWSGVKLPIWLPTFLLAITCVLHVQMGHVNPFQISRF